MNLDMLDNALEAIADAKRELIRLDPSPSNKRDADEAYEGLAIAERAIRRLLSSDSNA